MSTLTMTATVTGQTSSRKSSKTLTKKELVVESNTFGEKEKPSALCISEKVRRKKGRR